MAFMRTRSRAPRTFSSRIVGTLALLDRRDDGHVGGRALSRRRPDFNLRLHLYSQLSMATEDSQKYVTSPEKFTGQMMQNRFFFNPELDTKFTSFLPHGWLDDLSGRLALWGFYDGLYDYGPEQYRATAADITFHNGPNGAFQTKGYSRDRRSRQRVAAQRARHLRRAVARQRSVHEHLASPLSCASDGRRSRGRGRHIGLLDANNPFDTTIVPGVFQDLDETRIPLWTLRATYQLFTDLGPFSSGLLDTYIVPGMIDTTTSPLQMQSASPYSAPPPAPGRVSRSSSAVRR